MKKHISLALAVAASIACTKVAPEDLNSIETIPQDENKESISDEPQGEKIMIQVPQTKVTLSGDHYVFESGDVITVVATNGAYASMTTSATGEQGQFEGEFNSPVGKTSDTFKFYYNYSETTPEQNGKPWLVATAECSREAGSNTFKADDGTVYFEQPSNTIVLALNSSYNCTVDFHTLDGNQNISGITVSQGTPYFLNVTGGISGGFYLAVNKTGETGTMYTRYGKDATVINSNQIVSIKEFTPLSFQGELSGFNTSYSLYTNTLDADRVATANAVTNDYMSGGSLKLTVSGISDSLLSLISLNNITVSSSDGVTIGSTTSQPSWENKEYTWTFGDATYHTTWGEWTVNATAVFKGPAGEQIEASIAPETRYITGLPYEANPPSNSGTNIWTATNGSICSSISWKDTYVQMEGISKAPVIKSPSFHIPETLSFTASFDILIHSRQPTTSIGTWMYPKFTAETNGSVFVTQEPTEKTEDCTFNGIAGDSEFTPSGNTISLKSSISTASPYICVFKVKVIYR